jgi:outer membrane protein OmpA-like peptidoglycan-associated protein
MQEVTNIAEILKAFPNVELKIGGYTDNVGKEELNQKLSADRAFNVVKALVEQGIDSNRVVAEGYGSKYPVAANDTEEGRAQNRRIAVRVTKK